MNELIRIETIARNIRALRTQRHLSQEDMGEMLGYSARQIRRLETDGTCSLDVVNRIAQAFGVSSIDILLR